MDVDSTNFSTSLSTHPSEHITNVLVEWNDLEIATCVSSLISWITAEEETLIQFEVDTFLKQWESTGLSLQHAFKLALMYNEAWLTDELVEELQDMVQKNNMETSAHLDLLNKMARTNLKCISGLYEKHHAHPELKETAVQSTNMAVASSSEVCASNEVMSILKPVPESNSIRKKEVQDLVTTFSYEWREKALLGYHLNAILTKTSQALSENSELSDQVLQSKLSIPLHDYQTYTVPNVDYLVDYFTRKWGKLTDQEWNQLATTFLNISSQQKQQALSSPTFNTLPEPIDKLSPDYSTACITALAPLLEKLPSNARIHIAFQTHPSEGEETSSSDPKYTVMSSTHPEAVGTSLHGPLFQEWMQQPTPSAPHLVMESTPGHVQAWTPEAMMAPVPLGYAMAIPLRMLSGTVGFIYVDALQQVSFTKAFTTTEDMKVFLDTHAKVLQEASDQLRRTLDTMDQLHQIRVIVESSVSFLREQAQADPTFYLVQAPYLYSVGLQSSHVLETTDWASLCHTLKTQPPLTVVERTEATEFMYQCVSTKMNQSNGPQTALPILDSSGQVSVVMVLASFSSTETLQSDDLKEVQKIAQVLGSALSTATKRKPVRKLGLAAEALDSQGELIFVTFMLDSIRESIRELDSSAIAELKSYKKPPPTIHKVLKCLCYLFGKTPKQVKLWSDTIKYINMDMLKQMLNYDPTAIQKKSIFIRIRKVLKTIPHGDVRKKGSLPALTVYAWLLVSLDLRDKSIQARRRAMEKEGKKSSEPPEEDLEVDEPLEDELTDEDA
ncbi:EF-hand calcium-binding domain-containing protein 5 [Coelomomyces lativittatus]|nr:EF-hand calcium-binding domain-containing protein 5 [Coelomomyces lativittatus]KAJ1510133.1 EF-hand calcium-binding domain-containing protein 5 [Coelomomyces lativittatus]